MMDSSEKLAFRCFGHVLFPGPGGRMQPDHPAFEAL
jgi:hypothetical protein